MPIPLPPGATDFVRVAAWADGGITGAMKIAGWPKRMG